MDWATCEPQIRFDIRAEREECQQLFKHQARALQDRMVRRGRTDRTRLHGYPRVGKNLPNRSAGAWITGSGKSAKLGQREAILLCAQASIGITLDELPEPRAKRGSAPEFFDASFHSGLRPAVPLILDNARRLRHNSLC
jgi:hypothetical protein